MIINVNLPKRTGAALKPPINGDTEMRLFINQIKSNSILLVTYTCLADVIAVVAKCLCF